MALDVRLTRNIDEKWGFEIDGGAENETTITVVKLQSSSPASRAGLENGDAIFSINGEEAIDFTNEEACRRIAECGETLTFGVMRGLYDPVLDDQEPIYYEPGDLDPQSQPTEVPFKIQKFIEPEDLGSSVLNYGTNNDPSAYPYDPSILLLESRSLTASPFVNPKSPYRPFSTEPIPQIPPLEDPIILNPEYKDQFGKGLDDIDPDYILNACNEYSLKSKFKLPISKQYNPNGAIKIENEEIDSVLNKYIKMETLCKQSIVTTETITNNIATEITVKDSISKDTKQILTKNLNTEERFKSAVTNSVRQEDSSDIDLRITEKDFVLTENIEDELINIELNHIEKMNEEASITQIEKTALAVIENSIEQAISVTEKIKKEMEEELFTTPNVRAANEIIESDDKIQIKSEGNVKQSAESRISNMKMENRQLDSTEIQRKVSREEQVKNEKKYERKEVVNGEKSDSISKSDMKTENGTKLVASDKIATSYATELTRTRDSFYESEQLEKKDESKVDKKITTNIKSKETEAKKRTYAIGLHTIPNIRGVVHSSCHYDLLLKTFFIHLTDVMVGLSRFVLTQPVFNAETNEIQENVYENERYEKIMKNEQTMNQKKADSINKVDIHTVAETKIKDDLNEKKTKEVTENVMKHITVQEKQDNYTQNFEQDVNIIEKKRELKTPIAFQEINNKSPEKVQTIDINQKREDKIMSGAQMAQRTEKKLTKDMTQKMDAVISEFQTVAVEEDKKEWFQRNRRSRSRSQIEEEVAKESDPLEWLSKVDNQRASSQEITKEKLFMNKKEYSASETMESKQNIDIQKQEVKHKKFKSPKQMYVAIVEAHVYTNKNVIFEDVAEFSETSSIQSAEEINSAYEAIETMTTENVALENAAHQIEHAKVIEEWEELPKVDVQSAITTQKSNEHIQESKSIIQEKTSNEERALEFINDQEVAYQESVSVIEPVVEIKKLINNKSLSVAESNEINIVESKSELSTMESKTETTGIIEEIIDDYRTRVMTESEKVKIDDEIIGIKSEQQIEDVVCDESVILKSQKPTITIGEEYAALKIIKEVETEDDSPNVITEIEEVLDVSKYTDAQTAINKMEMSEEQAFDESKVITEKSFISSEFDLTKSELSMQSVTKVTSEASSLNFEQIQNYKTENNISNEIIQDSSFTAESVDRKLALRIDLNKQKSTESECSTIDTPTPSTVPPTPLTDEYVFKLTIPLPKSRGITPIPRDCTLSPEDEDPQIVKKKLIPHIETTIEKVIYDPPLPTPPGDRVLSPPIYKIPGLFGGGNTTILKPMYRKPGLFGGADNPEYSKEEIREIERKSSLLASAIDQTIKSIEEYKEEVGIDTKKEVKVTEFQEEICSKTCQKNYSQEIIMNTQTQKNSFIGESKTINEHVENNDSKINEHVENNDSKINADYINISAMKVDEISKDEVSETISSKNSMKDISEIVDEEIVKETSLEVAQEIEAENKKEISEEAKIEESVTEKEALKAKVAETLCLKGDSKTISDLSENDNKKINTNYINNSTTKVDEISKDVISETVSFENSTKDISETVDKKIEKETLLEVSQEIEVENKKEMSEEAKVEELVTEKDTLKTKMTEILCTEVQKETLKPNYVEEINTLTNGKDEVVIDNRKKSNSILVENNSQPSEVKENGEKEAEIHVVANGEISGCKIEVPDVLKGEEKKDPMLGFRSVVFEPEAVQKRSTQTIIIQDSHIEDGRQTPYMTESGEIIGTIQGIVDGLEEPILDEDVASVPDNMFGGTESVHIKIFSYLFAEELGKPGISEETIAELISGEAEMLREAHVMGLSRVLTSHMHRVDDSSIDFQKIKPMIGSLKDSEVLKALNEELARQKEEQRKKEEKRWTTFLQKPKRPVPKAKFGYHGWTEAEQALVAEPYKVKIIKQAKPKVAPDYKPEDFETGPLPWEARAELEASLPPVEAEEPILVPEVPEFLEAIDPLKESEVPDLEDTGIPLPPPKDPSPPPEVQLVQEDIVIEKETEVQAIEEIRQEEEEIKEDMENRLAEQLVRNVQSMVDPNASIEQQLCQMRAQLAALAQLPEVIQKSLEVVSSKLKKMTHQEATMQMSASHMESQSYQTVQEKQNITMAQEANHVIANGGANQHHSTPQENGYNNMTIEVIEDNMETGEQQIVQQENRRVCQTPLITGENQQMEKMKKAQLANNNLDAEGRQIKQRATPRVGKPKRMFGPLDPDSRAVVLPGGRRWRKTEDVYNEQLIAETLQAQSELLQGKTMGFESDLLPYDNRINFMKYEKPPVTLDHLKDSETYKLVHDMDQPPLKRVEMLTPVIAEADYRERCRSMTPSSDKKHLQIPQQFHP